MVKKDFLDEMWAYSLKNAIEFGKADTGKILPKLFQHGLEKSEIKNVMPEIKKIVKEVNSMSQDERVKRFEKYSSVIPEKEEEERGLPELPNAGKKPVFRVAPFPSGALHLGNAKTFLINAMYAEKYNGRVFLVMDDTIGSEKKPLEKESYGLIKDALKYLKVKYDKIVYKSDRLDIYYKYAEELIKKDKAYVDYSTQAEFQKLKEEGKDPGDKYLPVEVQLKRWKEMFKMKEGHGVLRIKTSMKHPNPAFRDRVLFKISDRKHVRKGKKYRVWPTLEMSWAIDDHLLGITHIIRGNELMIESDMERYIWDIFGWKHPEIIHTGLVKIEGLGAKISKSKAREEVRSGAFRGWDDPRTWSIQSLEKRGIRAEAIRNFVEEIGLNKQDITVPIESLYAHNRKIIDPEANRYYFVKKPVEIKISNKPDWKTVEIPIHPDKSEKRRVKIDKIFISEEDFSKLKGKEVRLLHLFNVDLDKESEVTSIDNKNIPRIHWVSHYVKARILMPDGEWIDGVAESSIKNLKVGETIQFERFGFVKYDGQRKGIQEFWFSHR